jgi:hypothetical protein
MPAVAAMMASKCLLLEYVLVLVIELLFVRNMVACVEEVKCPFVHSLVQVKRMAEEVL